MDDKVSCESFSLRVDSCDLARVVEGEEYVPYDSTWWTAVFVKETKYKFSIDI